ncbi:hypothetical protein Dsin_012514 [Dipteronia sinensis]|uniref:Zinc knuckle CX2CX4HX4C domain-containing protein n=1 Tax=Dipteronia sinensis TaxID=43782 RepID=A0AAE0E889_9ROSI|nr:hypothetical protein Dsin_012514 [Dipteronia sinensis]
MIGEVTDVDEGSTRDCAGKLMRVRVLIDVSKPLKRFLRVDILGDGVETILVLRYERLQSICFKCGRVSHRTMKCNEKMVVSSIDGVEKYLYGPWMKADEPSNKSHTRDRWNGLARVMRPGSYQKGRSSGSWTSNGVTVLEANDSQSKTSPGLDHGGFGTGSEKKITKRKWVRKIRASKIGDRGNFEAVREITGKRSLGLLEVQDGIVGKKQRSSEMELLTKIEAFSPVGNETSTRLEYLHTIKAEVGKSKQMDHLTKIESKEMAGPIGVLPMSEKDSLKEISTDREIEVSLLSYTQDHIDVKIKRDKGLWWRFMGFYGKPVQDQRKHSSTLLRRLATMSHLPWICIGDFNEIMWDNEKGQGDFDSLKKMRWFRFEECWVDDIECKQLIDTVWNGNEMSSSVLGILEKLDKCGKLLESWNITKRQKQRYWKQRARVEWLKQDDKNTRFFHSKASSRKAINRISGLQDENGNWKENKHELKEIIGNYFQKLFTSSGPNQQDLEDVLVGVKQKLSRQGSRFLDTKFLAEEVSKAVFDMKPTKAPGLDGLPAVFYQKFWESVGQSVVLACLRGLNDGDTIDGMSHCFNSKSFKTRISGRLQANKSV